MTIHKPQADVHAALDSLQSSLKDALHSLLVSHCAGYVSSTEYSIKRSSIEGHISNCEIIRAALTAQLTKTDDNVSCPRVANTGDINTELLKALKEIKYKSESHLNNGLGDFAGYISDIRMIVTEAIARAKQKGQQNDQH